VTRAVATRTPLARRERSTSTVGRARVLDGGPPVVLLDAPAPGSYEITPNCRSWLS
jgi:hypothetical protein